MNIVELQKKIFPQIKEVLNKEPESISLIEKTGEGWNVQCEILERKAIPETFDLLKVFQLSVNKNAEISDFKQIKKIRRGDTTVE